jgi:secondary thiamine-phosphate synthase enzyme
LIQQYELTLPPYPRGFHIITKEVLQALPFQLPETGLMNVFIKHTSAGLAINENADYTVRVDLENIFNKLVPESTDYHHNDEGYDDMPAHGKAILSGSSINIPISNGKLNLGTWQGIYLCEYRNKGGERKIVITVQS